MNNCLHCNKETTNPKFCSKSCAQTYNNSRRAPRTEESRAKTSASMKMNGYRHPKRIKRCKISFCIMCSLLIRNSYRKTCSEICLRTSLSKNKPNHPKNKKSIDYNGIKLGSSYEVLVAKSLDDNNIRWIQPSPLPYKDNKGKLRHYFPDFYLPEFDVYLDPKNDFLINHVNPYHGFKDSDKIKWCSVQNNTEIIILNKDQLTWDVISTLIQNGPASRSCTYTPFRTPVSKTGMAAVTS